MSLKNRQQLQNLIAEKLKESFETINAVMTKDEFLEAFETVLAVVKEIKSSTDSAIQHFQEKDYELEELKDKLEKEIRVEISDNTKGISELKKNLSKEISTFFQKIGGDFKQIEDKLLAVDLIDDKIRKGEERIINEVLAKVPEQEELTSEQVRNKLESLQDEERLSISAINGLEEVIDEIKKKPKVVGGGGFSKIALEIHIIDDETPVDTGDATNFTIVHIPSPTTSLKLYRGGQRQRITEDFTLSGRTITLLTSLVAGEILWVDYRI